MKQTTETLSWGVTKVNIDYRESENTSLWINGSAYVNISSDGEVTIYQAKKVRVVDSSKTPIEVLK